MLTPSSRCQPCRSHDATNPLLLGNALRPGIWGPIFFQSSFSANYYELNAGADGANRVSNEDCPYDRLQSCLKLSGLPVGPGAGCRAAVIIYSACVTPLLPACNDPLFYAEFKQLNQSQSSICDGMHSHSSWIRLPPSCAAPAD